MNRSIARLAGSIERLASMRATMKFNVTILALSAALLADSVSAQAPNDPAIEACRASGLLALQERSPSVKDLIFDIESLAVSPTDTKIENIPVRMVIMGEAYLERRETGKAHRFICLIGEKGKVLMTFFTAQ
jgi:hypothetical protein